MIPTPCTLVGASVINYINNEKIELWHNYDLTTFVISSAFNILSYRNLFKKFNHCTDYMHPRVSAALYASTQ